MTPFDHFQSQPIFCHFGPVRIPRGVLQFCDCGKSWGLKRRGCGEHSQFWIGIISIYLPKTWYVVHYVVKKDGTFPSLWRFWLRGEFKIFSLIIRFLRNFVTTRGGKPFGQPHHTMAPNRQIVGKTGKITGRCSLITHGDYILGLLGSWLLGQYSFFKLGKIFLFKQKRDKGCY